ncbi:MAG: winged helix-turn-helix transcriptional regulator [Candidatus Alcyoniella australis]|nr:winged helix-turn-helix transcriptional regulator [Candidatus Alcyoniella australis]
MEKDYRNTLAIMEQIELDGSQSQRNISHKVGMALGMTNAYLKRLVNKGHVMVLTMPRNRILYNLTPKGISEKARLTMLYMRDSVDFYSDLKFKISRALLEIERSGVQSVALVGEGEILEIALLCMLDTKLRLDGIYSQGTQIKRVARKQVKPLERLDEGRYQAVLLAQLNPDEKLIDRLQSLGADKSRIMLINGQWAYHDGA